MAARCGWDTVFCVPAAVRVGVQRLLSSADDGALASDAARHWDRAALANGKSGMAGILRCGLLPVERTVGDLLWSGTRQRDPRRTAGIGRLLFRATLDQFPPGPTPGHSRLVHHPRGSRRSGDSDRARRPVCNSEDGWRTGRPGTETGAHSVALATGTYPGESGGHVVCAPVDQRKLSRLSNWISDPARGFRKSGFDVRRHTKAEGTAGIPGFLRVHHGNVVRGGVCTLSCRLARQHRSDSLPVDLHLV